MHYDLSLLIKEEPMFWIYFSRQQLNLVFTSDASTIATQEPLFHRENGLDASISTTTTTTTSAKRKHRHKHKRKRKDQTILILVFALMLASHVKTEHNTSTRKCQIFILFWRNVWIQQRLVQKIISESHLWVIVLILLALILRILLVKNVVAVKIVRFVFKRK